MADSNAAFGTAIVKLLERELAPIKKKLTEIDGRLKILERCERRFSIFRRDKSQ
jgi:hypothetical protein